MKYVTLVFFALFAFMAALNWYYLYLNWRNEQQRKQNPDIPRRYYSITPVSLVLFFFGALWMHKVPLPLWTLLLVLLDPCLLWPLAKTGKKILGKLKS